MHTRCPVCHRPILALRVLFMPLWKRWDCPDCGSLLGVDRNRRLLAMIPWFLVVVVLVAVVKITRYGMLIAIPILVLSMLIMLMPFSRPIVLARGGFRCRACGYDLRGQAEPACPECGQTLAADDLDRFRQLTHGDAVALQAPRDEASPMRRRDRILVIAIVLIMAATLAAGIVVHHRASGAAPGSTSAVPVVPAPSGTP